MTDTISPPNPDDDAPIDAEFEPALSRKSSLARRRSPGWLAFLALGSFSFLSFALAAVAFGLISGLKAEITTLRADRDIAQEARTALALEITNNNAELRVLNTALKDTSGSVAIIENLIESVQSSVDELSARPDLASASAIDPETGEAVLTPVNPLVLDRLEMLENAISTFPPAGPAIGGTDAIIAQIAELRLEMERLHEAGDHSILPLATEAENSDAAAALALSAIEAAARRGQPFQSGYQRLVTAMPDNRKVKTLELLARTGAPTLADLRGQFSVLERRALDVEAVRIGGGASWMRSIFGDGITIRRTGEDGAADAINDAKASLSQGDLPAAIAQIETLETDVQAVFTDWLDNARKRQSLEDGLEALRLAMIAKDHP
ncbi:MAG: hypothetical protein L3J02_08835 [Henriciella sp.]|nr:hypothetical protein [Henriciella sp.]